MTHFTKPAHVIPAPIAAVLARDTMRAQVVKVFHDECDRVLNDIPDMWGMDHDWDHLDLRTNPEGMEHPSEGRVMIQLVVKIRASSSAREWRDHLINTAAWYPEYRSAIEDFAISFAESVQPFLMNLHKGKWDVWHTTSVPVAMAVEALSENLHEWVKANRHLRA